MSALRVSRPGHPTLLIEQEPARARVAGYGGSLVTHPITVTHKPALPKRLPRQPLNRTYPRCDQLTRFRQPCGRRPNHKGRHSSISTVTKDNERRRAYER